MEASCIQSRRTHRWGRLVQAPAPPRRWTQRRCTAGGSRCTPPTCRPSARAVPRPGHRAGAGRRPVCCADVWQEATRAEASGRPAPISCRQWSALFGEAIRARVPLRCFRASKALGARHTRPPQAARLAAPFPGSYRRQTAGIIYEVHADSKPSLNGAASSWSRALAACWRRRSVRRMWAWARLCFAGCLKETLPCGTRHRSEAPHAACSQARRRAAAPAWRAGQQPRWDGRQPCGIPRHPQSQNRPIPGCERHPLPTCAKFRAAGKEPR